MKFEWNKKQNNKIICVYVYYLNYLLSLNNFLLSNDNYALQLYFFKTFNLYNYLNTQLHFKKTFLLSNFNDKNLLKFFNFKINKDFNSITSEGTHSTPAAFYLKKKTSSLFYRFLDFFFLFNYNLNNSKFKINHFFKLLYINDFKHNSISINVTKIFAKWNDFYNFLFNIFYYNYNILLFGSYLFKNEISALNWINFNLEMNAWRYCFPFFTLKTNIFNKKIDFFFNKLKSSNFDFFLITDSHYHFKNLYFFKKYKFFTIALNDLNLNPNLFNYSIPVISSNNLVQFFFLKFTILIQKNVRLFKYNFFKKIWICNLKYKWKHLN